MDLRAPSPSADALKGGATAAADDCNAAPEAEKNEGLIEIAEGNVVSACSVFVASVVLDALNALPSTVVVDVPTSMHTTALVLIALVAAPPVDPNLLFEQRGIAGLFLFVTAFVGLHQGGVNARIADALYSLLCGWAVLLIFGVSGPKPGQRGYDAKGKRENVLALSAGFLGYSGARIVRSALYHAGEVTSFSATHDDITTRGYAMADDLVCCALAFGGTLCVCAAVIILINHDEIYEHGCAPIASVVAQLSILIFVSAFVVQIACYARIDELEALFGDSACVGDSDVCGNSYRARRLYTANSSPAALWACAVGLTILAFPHDRRCKTRRDYFLHPEDVSVRVAAWGSGNVALAASFVAVVVVWNFAGTWWPSMELLLLFFSIPVAWYSSTWIACALHASGMLVYTVGRLGSPLGFDLTYLTHWFVMATLLITLTLAVTTFISWLLYASCVSTGRYIQWLENLTALLIVALMSLQLFLIIASLGIISGYDGGRMSVTSWRSASLQWVTQHSLGFFFAAALVGGRFECQNERIQKWLLQTVWFSLPVCLTALWLATLFSTSTWAPYGTTGDASSIVIATLAALLPWGITGVVIC
tara:strand:- start:90 stop:1868 length:1779 start_codon:yes stop_codon:yes gene_type:complete